MRKKDIAGKYRLIVASGIVATLLAAPVYAQTNPAPASASPAPAAPAATAPVPVPARPAVAPQAQSATPVEDKAAEAKHFSDYKQQMLVKVDDLMTRIKEKRSCIQASTSRETMRTCFAQMAQNSVSPASGSATAPQPQPTGASPATSPAVKK